MTTKPNRSRSLAALLLLLVFAAYMAIGGITYSRFIESFVGDNPAQVAKGIVHYERGALLLNDESVPYTSGAEELVINAIAPGDRIEYNFSLADSDGFSRNEVLLRVNIVFSIRLELLVENAGGDFTTVTRYFSALESENNERGESGTEYLAGASCELYVLSANNIKNIIAPPATAGELTGVDYIMNTSDLSGKKLFTERGDDTPSAVFEHKAGVYLYPAGGSAQEYNFTLNLTLPSQAMDSEGYADARIVVDVRVESEQVLSVG